MKGNLLPWLRQEEVFQPAGVRLSLWTYRDSPQDMLPTQSSNSKRGLQEGDKT